MFASIVLLGEPGSSFCARLGAALAGKGADCVSRSLDAVFEGRPVTIAGRRVQWDGIDLLEAGAVFLERPVFSWPQRIRIKAAREGPAGGEPAVAGDREALSLTVSAIAAAQKRPMLNRPGAGALAASRARALVELASAGLPVHPWRLEAAPEPQVDRDATILDPIGRERWHQPHRPPAGDPCLRLDPAAGPVLGALVVGGRLAGVQRFASAAAWTAGRGAEPAPAHEAPGGVADLAIKAAGALDLEIAEVWIGGAPEACQTLLVEAGPDHEAWDALLNGAAAARIADRLMEITRRENGRHE